MERSGRKPRTSALSLERFNASSPITLFSTTISLVPVNIEPLHLANKDISRRGGGERRYWRSELDRREAARWECVMHRRPAHVHRVGTARRG